MKRRIRAWIAPLVMAGLTIWATGVTFGGLGAEEDEISLRCVNQPWNCEHYDGQCWATCHKDLFPWITCCWLFGEE